MLASFRKEADKYSPQPFFCDLGGEMVDQHPIGKARYPSLLSGQPTPDSAMANPVVLGKEEGSLPFNIGTTHIPGSPPALLEHNVEHIVQGGHRLQRDTRLVDPIDFSYVSYWDEEGFDQFARCG